MPAPTLLLLTGLPGTGKSSLAGEAADEMRCAVLGHDWTMAGLRAFPPVWECMREQGSSFRTIGWSIMWNLARAQLREGRSVALDGVARTPEVDGCRAVAGECRARCLVALTDLADEQVHRSRIEGRQRDIPHWPELTWESVAAARSGWQPPDGVDLVLNSEAPFAANAAALRALVR